MRKIFSQLKTKPFKFFSNTVGHKKSVQNSFFGTIVKRSKLIDTKKLFTLTVGVTASSLVLYSSLEEEDPLSIPYNPDLEVFNTGERFPNIFENWVGIKRTVRAHATISSRFLAAVTDLVIFCGLPILAARLICEKLALGKTFQLILRGLVVFSGMAIYTLRDFFSPGTEGSIGKRNMSLIIVDYETNLKPSTTQILKKDLVDFCGWSLLCLLDLYEFFPRQVVGIGGTIAFFNLSTLFHLIHSRQNLSFGGEKRS